MGKIKVLVSQELIDLNPDANLETLLGETLTVNVPGFGVEDPIDATDAGDEASSQDFVGGHPKDGPK